MARPEFEAVVAQAARKYLFQFFQQETDEVAVGFSEGVSIFAPEGYMCSVVGMVCSCSAPAGAASGTHRIIVGYDIDNAIAGTQNIDLLLAQSNFGDALIINEMTATSATAQTYPAPEAFPAVIQQIRIDSEMPLSLVYANQSDVVQTNPRKYCLAIVAEQVAG